MPSVIPIDNLPYDVLYTIYTLVVQGQPEFIATISHVSTRWRTLCVESPQFWTKISFHRPRMKNQTVSWLEKQETWLLRSCNALLDVEIGDPAAIRIHPRDFVTFDIKQLADIMALVLPHVSRWRSFRLQSLGLDGFTYVTDQLWDLSAPHLETLAILTPTPKQSIDSPENYQFGPFRGGSGIPMLKHFSIGQSHLIPDWNPTNMIQSLTSFHAYRLPLESDLPQPASLRTIRLLVSKNPHLRSLTLETAPRLPPSSITWQQLSELIISIPKLSLPELTYLDFGKNGHYSLQYLNLAMVNFLLMFDAPNLRELTPDGLDETSIYLLSSMPTMPFPQLRHLTLIIPSFPAFASRQIFVVLSQLQALQALTIQSGGIPKPGEGGEEEEEGGEEEKDWPKDLFEPLSTMLPHLSRLTLHLTPTISHYRHRCDLLFPIDVIKNIVMSRLRSTDVASLRTLDLGRRRIGKDDEEWFRERVGEVIIRAPLKLGSGAR